MTALSALSKEDPQGSARLRLDLAERFLAKAEEYVRKGTPFRRRRRVTGPLRRSLGPGRGA